MALANHERNAIKHATINAGLDWQSFQCISIAFQFKSGQFTIDHGYIDTNSAGPYIQFLENECVFLARVLCAEKLKHCAANVTVTHKGRLSFGRDS